MKSTSDVFTKVPKEWMAVLTNQTQLLLTSDDHCEYNWYRSALG